MLSSDRVGTAAGAAIRVLRCEVARGRAQIVFGDVASVGSMLGARHVGDPPLGIFGRPAGVVNDAPNEVKTPWSPNEVKARFEDSCTLPNNERTVCSLRIIVKKSVSRSVSAKARRGLRDHQGRESSRSRVLNLEFLDALAIGCGLTKAEGGDH